MMTTETLGSTNGGAEAPGSIRYKETPAIDGRRHVSGEGNPEIHLSFPAASRYLRLARLTASGLAGDLGFSVDEIEDLRVAVDELAAAVIDGVPPTAELALVFREIDGGLEIEGRCNARTDDPPVLNEVARELLGILADDYSIGTPETTRNFRLRKLIES
jgi:serine/threonine-protein kinase RsbW